MNTAQLAGLYLGHFFATNDEYMYSIRETYYQVIRKEKDRIYGKNCLGTIVVVFYRDCILKNGMREVTFNEGFYTVFGNTWAGVFNAVWRTLLIRFWWSWRRPL